jgi:AraC-like DNA-binding protein
MSGSLLVNMAIVRPIMIAAVDAGARMEDICHGAGIDPALVNDPQATVTLALRCRILEECERLANDPFLGLRAGQSASPMILGIAGHLMETSANMGEVFDNLARFSATFSQQISFETRRDGDRFIFQAIPTPIWEDFSPTTIRTPVDMIFSAAIFLFKLLNGRQVRPLAAHYRYPRPADASVHEQHLRVAPLWNQKHNMLVMHGSDMELPVIGHNPELNLHFQRLLEERLQAMEQGSNTAAEVRRIILRHFRFSLPDLMEVAGHMHITPRTLQRRLAQEGNSFQSIVDAVKRDLSLGMLANKRLSVSEVGYKLGYGEPAAFQRAFKRWTGSTPASYRTSN